MALEKDSCIKYYVMLQAQSIYFWTVLEEYTEDYSGIINSVQS